MNPSLNNKVYVGNLPYTASKEELEDFFRHCGVIEKISLVKDRETDRPKGFGFVTFETEEEATKALDMNGAEISGRKVRVNLANQN